MSWFQVVMIIIGILRAMRSSDSQETFCQNASVKAIGDGELGKWLWENREQIIEFVITLIGLFSGKARTATEPVE